MWFHNVSTSDRELPSVLGDVVGVYRRRWQLYSGSAHSRRRRSWEHRRGQQDCERSLRVVVGSVLRTSTTLYLTPSACGYGERWGLFVLI